MTNRSHLQLGDEEFDALMAATQSPGIAKQHWVALMARMPFDQINENTQRSIPAIFSNLRNESDVPERERMRGAFKYTWAKNTRMLFDVRPVLQELDRLDVNYRVIKGAAVLAHQGQFGSRIMGDIDLLISASDCAVVEKVFIKTGFRRSSHSVCAGHSEADHFEALNFNAGATHVDLHVAEFKYPNALLELMLEQPAQLLGTPIGVLPVPDSHLLLLHSAVHGQAAHGPTDLMQTALDFTTLSSTIALSTLLIEARQTGTLSALATVDQALAAINIQGSGAHLNFEDRLTSRTKYLAQRSRSLLLDSSSLLRRTQAARDRRRSAHDVQVIEREFSGHRSAYLTWLKFGKIAPLERAAVNQWGGFLPQPAGTWSGKLALQPFMESADGVEASHVGTQAMDWRFRVSLETAEDTKWFRLDSKAFEHLDAVVLCNGVLVGRIYAGDERSQSFAVHGGGHSMEISLRPYWKTCDRCYSGFPDLTLTAIDHGPDQDSDTLMLGKR